MLGCVCVCACQLWQRISALEEMLRSVHSKLAAITDSAGAANVSGSLSQSISLNKTPEFRAPLPVTSSDEEDAAIHHYPAAMRPARSASCSQLLSRSVSSLDTEGSAVRGRMAAPSVLKAISSANQTATLPSPLPKRRKFADD